MAKVIKTAALVIGAAALIATGVGAVAMGGLAGSLTIAGVSTSTLFLTSSGLAMAAGLLQKTPQVPKSQTDRLTASVDPRAFRKTPLGETAFPVDVRYEEWSGADQDYCDWIVCVASCAVESAADQIWLNQELAWSRTGGVTAKFQNYFSVPNIINEGTAANAFTFGSGKWNQSRRLTGCAYVRLRFKVTGNGKKGESPFAGGIPSRITIIGRGAKLYDPRRDSTVPGGSGPMRADDQSTWRYVAQDGATIGKNLPLHVLRDLLGWRIQNPANGQWKLAVGCGIPKRRIDLQSFIVAANIADERATRSSGGTEPKYHGACVLSEGEDPRSRQDTLLAACNGKLQDTNGKLSLRIAHNDLAAVALDPGLDDHDVVGGFTWDPDPALEQTPNVARGKYVDPSPASLYQPIDYPEVRIESPDGIDRVMPMDLGAVESGSHAQRIVKQALQRKQYARHFAAPFDITAWRYNVGDVVPFTFAPLSFNRKLFRIVEMDPRSNPCPVVLREENAAIYQWDADDRAPVQAAEPNVYDSSKNPLVLAINDAGNTSNWSGVVDDDGNRPEDGATKGAPTGTVIHDRVAEQLVRDLDFNTDEILFQALRQDNLLQVFDARTLVQGQPVGTSFLSFRQAQQTENAAIATTLNMIGAKTADGTGFALNMASVQIAPGKKLATTLDEIGLVTADVKASVADLREVLIDEDGVTARGVLKLDVNGNVSGYIATNDGNESAFNITADVFRVVDPNNGTPMRVFEVEGGIVKAKSLEVGRITYEALVDKFAGQNQSYSNDYAFMKVPGGLIYQAGIYRAPINDEIALSIVFPTPFPTRCIAFIPVAYIATQSSLRDMWVQNLGAKTRFGASVQTQAARDAAQQIDGIEWFAVGF